MNTLWSDRRMRLCRVPSKRRTPFALSRRTGFLGLLGLLVLHTPLAVAADAAPGMVAQQAEYTLTLKAARNDVAAATGRMGYEVENVCTGWATRQRLAMTVTNRDGETVDMVSDYATWESMDGRHMNFHLRQTTDGSVTSELAGVASLQPDGGPGEAIYSKPKGKVVKLPKGTLFPTVHTQTIIAAAEAGRKFLYLPLFDGTGDDGAQNSSVAITSWRGPQKGKWAALDGLPSGTVHVAFFDRTPDTMEPSYEVGMRYWQNGVADDLSMDFGNFVMAGRMTTLKLLPAHC
jgi:hypothetical protein